MWYWRRTKAEKETDYRDGGIFPGVYKPPGTLLILEQLS